MSKVLNKLKHKFKFKNFKQTKLTTMSSVSVSANTFPDFFKSLTKLAKSNIPSPKELQTKKFAKAKRAKIFSKQRIVQAKIDKKEADKQAKIDKKEADKQAKIDKKEADKQAKIDKKEADKQAKIDKKEADKQAKIDKKEADKQAKIDKKKAEKQAKKQANTPETNNDYFLNTLFKLAKTNMPSPKELQTKKLAKAKRAKIFSKQRAKEALKQANILKKEEAKALAKTNKALAKADKILLKEDSISLKIANEIEREDIVNTLMLKLKTPV